MNKILTYMKTHDNSHRNIINRDNYEFYFNTFVASKDIKIWKDVLTKEVVKARWLMFKSIFIGIIGSNFTMYNYMACHGRSPMSPDNTMRTVGLMAASASAMLKRINILDNSHSYGWLKTMLMLMTMLMTMFMTMIL